MVVNVYSFKIESWANYFVKYNFIIFYARIFV
jgi:hypothetical protein